MRDELDILIEEFMKKKMDRRAFFLRAIALGISVPSITAFLASCSRPAPVAPTGPGPGVNGKPVNITVGYFPSWVGGWSGAIIKHQELWKKYLPAGSTINWDVQVVGPPIVNNLLANKSQIGYMGDAPALVATTKRDVADLRIVECNLFSEGQICSVLLVRPDAPEFKSTDEAVKWLDGKTVGVSGRGSCGDRFVNTLIKRFGIQPKLQYLDPTIILSNLQAKKIDAAQAFQPHVAQLETQGIGRVVAVGNQWGAQDADFILMRKDFIDAYPEAAKGWIKADIEALQFMLQYPYETVKLVGKDLPGYTTKSLWMAIYGKYREGTGAQETNVTAQVDFDARIMDFVQRSFKFLYEVKAVTVDTPPQGAIYDGLVKQALKEMGIQAPLGVIKGLPETEFRPPA